MNCFCTKPASVILRMNGGEMFYCEEHAAKRIIYYANEGVSFGGFVVRAENVPQAVVEAQTMAESFAYAMVQVVKSRAASI